MDCGRRVTSTRRPRSDAERVAEDFDAYSDGSLTLALTDFAGVSLLFLYLSEESEE